MDLHRRITVPLCFALAAVLAFTTTAVRADPASDLLRQLLHNELMTLLPDGSLTLDDPPPFGHTIHEVTHDNQDSWKIQASGGTVTFEEDQCDSAETPIGTGALHLVVLATGSSARLRATRYHRTYLRDLTRLDYWACEEVNQGQQWPFIALEIDLNNDNKIDDELIFEPAYQNPGEGGLCGALSAQGPEDYDKWQYWDGLRKDPSAQPTTFKACWWSVEHMAEFPPGFTIRRLSEYIATYPDAAIVNRDGNHGGIQMMHGFAPGAAFNGWVDAVTIGKDMNKTNGQTENSTVTYDYECGPSSTTPCP
jgi:hypothetical protein